MRCLRGSLKRSEGLAVPRWKGVFRMMHRLVSSLTDVRPWGRDFKASWSGESGLQQACKDADLQLSFTASSGSSDLTSSGLSSMLSLL